jgi:hypothetical protein
VNEYIKVKATAEWPRDCPLLKPVTGERILGAWGTSRRLHCTLVIRLLKTFIGNMLAVANGVLVVSIYPRVQSVGCRPCL